MASTISGNQSEGGGGGGIIVGQGRLAISNSTLAGNRSHEFGGGIWNQGGQVTANAVTVVRNVGGLGGGLFYGAGGPGFDVPNSLIALNRMVGGGKNDCAGDDEFDSFGHNLLSTRGPGPTCRGFDKPSDRVRSNPKIGRLARNGGPTKTIAVKRRSPAIGKANRHTAPKRDQRGRKRDRPPDIGAFERLP